MFICGSEKLALDQTVLYMVMKHNYLFFSISDENKETSKSLESEGEGIKNRFRVKGEKDL